LGRVSNDLEAQVPAVKDFSKILADIRRGFWVAIPDDEQRVVSHDGKLEETLRRVRESGKDDPILIRIPDSPSSLSLQRLYGCISV
jgi:hypothetical protein